MVRKAIVPEDYKKTELGDIPDDWLVKPLAEIGEVIRGASPRPKGDRRFYGGNVPRLMVEDITRDKHWVTPSVDFLTEEGAKRSRLCKRGTLTVVCSGTPTAVGLPALLAVNACIHDGILGLIKIEKNVSVDYLFHHLCNLQNRLHAAATHGGTFVNLTTEAFRTFKIILPSSKAEQQAIADALSDVDGLIASLDDLITKKRNIKQGTMQQLLTGKKRLPGFSGEWEVKSLGDVCNRFLNGGTPATSKPEYWNGTIPWVSGADVIRQKIAEVRRFITEDAVGSCSTNVIEKGNLLIVTRTGVGKLTVAPFDIAISQDMTGVYVKKEMVDVNYLFFYFDFNSAILKSYNQGTSISGITREYLMSIIIPLPPTKAEQTTIAEVLSDMDTEIDALEQKREKYKSIKLGMMQELLTGKTRLV